MSELLTHRTARAQRARSVGELPDGFDAYWRPPSANQSVAEAQWMLAEVAEALDELTARLGLAGTGGRRELEVAVPS